MGKLFLHYGPGGSAQAERSLFGTKYPIDFWDQPILHGDRATFSNLSRSAIEHSHNTHADQLIGHSFGCNLIDTMTGSRDFVSTVRISPIRDLHDAFISLGTRLAQNPLLAPIQKQNLIDLISTLNQAQANQKQHHFFSLVRAVFQNPHTQKQYWFNEASFEKFQLAQTQPHQRPFSPEMWGLVISDYLSGHHPIPRAGSKELVILGDNDPYYTSVDDEATYWKSLGYQVQVVKNAGHYVHLDSDIMSELLKF